MHGSIRDRLEHLLQDGGKGADRETAKHLAGCAECSSELDAMRLQRSLFKSLQAPELLEPDAGFYAGVLQRIEERRKDSIWASLIYSPLGTRLIYASLAIVIALGSYVVAHETEDGHLTSDTIVADMHYDAPVTGDRAEQRNAVLVNFASH